MFFAFALFNECLSLTDTARLQRQQGPYFHYAQLSSWMPPKLLNYLVASARLSVRPLVVRVPQNDTTETFCDLKFVNVLINKDSRLNTDALRTSSVWVFVWCQRCLVQARQYTRMSYSSNRAKAASRSLFELWFVLFETERQSACTILWIFASLAILISHLLRQYTMPYAVYFFYQW